MDLDGQDEVVRGTAEVGHLCDIMTGVKDYSGSQTALRAFRFASVATGMLYHPLAKTSQNGTIIC